jgi:hypothetical protein
LQWYFDANHLIADVVVKAGFSVPRISVQLVFATN